MRFVDMDVEIEFFYEPGDGTTHEVSQARIAGTSLIPDPGELLRDFPTWVGSGYQPGTVAVTRVEQDPMYREIFRVYLRPASS
jgi:hypothetical protein